MTGVPISDYKSLPKGWTKGRFKHLARIRNGQDYKRVEDQDGRYPVIGSGGEFARASAYLYDGESVLLGRKGTIDKPLYVNGRFWTVDTMFYTEIAPGNFPKFVYYLATTLPFDQLTTRTALPSMTQEALSNAGVVIPPYEEQGRIAAFLDHETARIDELVHEQERLQGLIQEKRHALIVKLVTHGEDATGPLIESRVPWIPCVPNHWRTFKLSNSFRTVGSGTTPPSTDDRWYGGDTPWITTGELREKVILDTRKRVSDLAIEAFPTLRRYPAGSVVIAMYGATIGRVGILGTPATVNQACCVLAHPTTLNSEFVFYWLQAHRENIARLGVGGGQPNISQEIVSSLRIPAPSLEEQAAIVGHLRHRIQEFDDLLSVSQRAVDLLLERRSALISAAVTGQLDLRNWRPPEPEAIAEVA